MMIIIRTIILISSFFISWTPYGVVAMYRAFINESTISALSATLPALFAKSSLLWPSLIILFGDKYIRNKLWLFNRIKKGAATERHV